MSIRDVLDLEAHEGSCFYGLGRRLMMAESSQQP
jgi:hypothetical protein